jgi:hypothetical protein
MEIITGFFGFCILCCAYAAQYWAYRSHQELKKMNEKFDALLAASSRKE